MDIGLTAENGKHKYEFMFDIKTPDRTYYLAVDTKDEMTTWVRMICSTCGLQSTKDEAAADAAYSPVAGTAAAVPLKAAEAQRGRHLGAEQAPSGVASSPKGTTAAWVTPASGGDLDELVRLSIVSRAVKKKRPHPCLTHIMHRADHKNLSQAFQVDFVFEHNKFSKAAKLYVQNKTRRPPINILHMDS